MKILYLSDHGPYSSTFIRQDVEAMSKIHEVLYVCFATDREYEGKNVPSRLIKYPAHSISSRIMWRLENAGIYSCWYNKPFSAALRAVIDEFRPDMIHCQFAYEGLKFFDNVDVDIPVVVNFRGYDASYKLRKACYVQKMKKILARQNVFPVFVCDALRKNLTEKGIGINEKHLILYTGVNTELFKKRNYEVSAQPVFIQTGTFNDKKGQEIAVRAFQQFLQKSVGSDAKLIFIGEGRNLPEVQLLVQELNITDKVEFTGKLPQEKIIQYLDKATVFVHHSITAPNGDMEGVPNAVIEAMAMELPILSTFHSGIPEAVCHKDNGLLCREGDIETLAEQMEEIIKWGYLPQNRVRVQEQFSINGHIDKLNNFYNTIV
jgi:colanic acid/amylovoran biosynthesis glycosyltransferase